MAKYKIIFDKEICVGTFACNSVAEKFFLIGKDGKAELNKAEFNQKTKKFKLIIDEEDLDISKEAESLCPVFAIKIEKLEK